MDIKVLYFWRVQETEVTEWEEPDFFLEIDFDMKKTLHRHWPMSQVSADTIF